VNDAYGMLNSYPNYSTAKRFGHEKPSLPSVLLFGYQFIKRKIKQIIVGKNNLGADTSVWTYNITKTLTIEISGSA